MKNDDSCCQSGKNKNFKGTKCECSEDEMNEKMTVMEEDTGCCSGHEMEEEKGGCCGGNGGCGCN